MSITRNPDGSYTIPATDLYTLIGQLDLGQLATDAGVTTTTPAPTPTPVPPPVPTPTPTSHAFKGIYNFGSNGSSLATNPSIAGTYLGYAWAQLEPQQGQFNWTQLDADMKPWLDNGKNIILRVSPSGWTKWKTPPLKSWTPPWVYSLGVQSVTEDDQAIKPQYWAPAFLQAYSAFVTALATRYDGNPHLICVEIGVGDGGETKPDTRNNPKRLAMWQKIGYTDAVWWDTIQKIIKIYQQSFKQTPLALMPNASFIAGSKGFAEKQIIDLAVSQNPPIWLQENGIIAGQKTNPEWLK